MEECRISVRELVEFTHHGEDIRPGGGLRDMQEGMLGHKARQRLLGDTWTAEKPVFIEIPVQDPEPWRLVVGGRMDAWREDPPCVEEIKLWQGREPPAEPATATGHNAPCYGAMVCKEETRPWVGLRVVYVDRRGKERACFEEIWTAERCRRFLMPWQKHTWPGSGFAARTFWRATVPWHPCAFPLPPIGLDSGKWRYRSTRPYAGSSGCLPACPRVQANPPRRCFRR